MRGFALDEYIGLPLTHPESYHATIHRTVVEPLGLDPAKVHVPGDVLNGTPLEDGDKVALAGPAYDRAIEAAGGIDVQILGIGTDGHVGFNEPGSSLASGTRVKTLAEQTRIDNARFFDNDINQVPTHCITQGIGTIMKARHLVLLAFGAGKAEAIEETVEGGVSAFCPASALQMHPHATIIVDEEAASRLRHKDYGASPERHPSSENCLVVEDVRKYFPVYKGIMKRKVGEVKAIEDICFTIKRGETLGVVGESGCGKTTLARCIMRMYEPDEGRIIFEGKDVAHASDKELKPYRPKVSMIFQDPFSSLDPRQNAGSIVGESLKIHHLVKDHAEYEKRVDELFRKVGLDPALKERVAHEFSGGQRQRIGIARALSSNPSLIICDEPISALDVSIQAQIINLLEQIQAEMGISYIFIAHDLAVVKHISDRILVMYLGRVMEIAPCEELYEHSLHPYTQALLSAIPVADPEIEENREVTTVQGEVPSILKRPSGCPFHNRCPQCTERCKQETPQLHEAFPGHFVACHLYGQK